MKAYADEAYYKDYYLCGKEAVINASFDYYARQASQLIDRYTYDNISGEDIPEEVKQCCCELAELMFRDEASELPNTGISSESVQGWSRSYESTEARKTALAGSQRSCIYKWLSNTGLLYSGV
ncbi:MAG: hypothetical protein IJX77_10325 [Ruminococcus sp.]|nr:hypothetical protein [Ruminococcus sp.]